jgi:hypothetical protein
MTVQASFLYQVYSPPKPLVGPHVVIFNDASGAHTLHRWDPTAYFTQNPCEGVPGMAPNDPECDYDLVNLQLTANGFSENQVQAVIFKSADPGPYCDLKDLSERRQATRISLR